MVGEIAKRKGSRVMRKLSLLLMGAVAGAGTTALVSQTQLLPTAVAASADTYRQLSLFGDVFEKVRRITSSVRTRGSSSRPPSMAC
jgi:carboxyl-terminal processing protease